MSTAFSALTLVAGHPAGH